MLKRAEILSLLREWYAAWDAHDLDRVMDLFHDDVLFENWTGGKAQGKAALREAWKDWFAERNFRFQEHETFVDEAEQKALYRWALAWPCREPGFEGEPEVRRGVDPGLVEHVAGTTTHLSRGQRTA